MKLIVIIYLAMVGRCASKFVTTVSDTQELMPFDCLHFNELVHAEPQKSEYDLEIPQSQTADQPTTPWGRASSIELGTE